MNKDKFQDKYNKVFQDLKEEKMNWDFEDFLNQVENQNKVEVLEETNIISLNSKKTGFSKWVWLAASVVILLGLGFIFIDSPKYDVDERSKLVINEIEKQKSDFIKENQDSQFAAHISDSTSGFKNDSIFIENSIADKDVLDDILSKKSRIKKQSKPRYVQNLKNTINDSLGYQDSYVIVNGKRIDNIEEAIDVAKYSFQVVANNINQAITPKVMDNVDY